MKLVIRRHFAKIQKFLLDTLFPISCLSCGKHGIWLCDSCLEKIPLRIEQVCPICEKRITPDGRVCFGCHKKLAIDGLLAASSYQNEAVPSAVHCFKYRFIEELAGPLGEILIKSLLHSQLSVPEIIIPVPLHKRRLRWRGFNQAELLANYLSKNLTPGFEIPMMNNLIQRKKYTRPQMEIKNHSRRQENLEDVFEIIKPQNNSSHASYADNASSANNINASAKNISNISVDPSCDRNRSQLENNSNFLNGRTVLLVDDIATTGSTLFECAKVLKQNGAKEVFAVVVARQEYGKK